MQLRTNPRPDVSQDLINRRDTESRLARCFVSHGRTVTCDGTAVGHPAAAEAFLAPV